MRLSVEILDHIFSLLAPHRETLGACLEDPVLSSIVERHFYHHLIVHISESGGGSNYAFEPAQLTSLVSAKPRILYHARILQIQIQIDYDSLPEEFQAVEKQLNEFANTLLMFPVLECIVLTNPQDHVWYSSDVFRAALKDRLNLPTVREVRLVGSKDFPMSLLDECKNLKNLSLSGAFGTWEARPETRRSALPQLKSLTLITHFTSLSLLDWVKLHISELQSLKCAFKSLFMEALSGLLGVCSETLNKLDVSLLEMKNKSEYVFRTGETLIKHMPEISPIPPNLRQLILRTVVKLYSDEHPTPGLCMSSLPAAAEAINLFNVPSLQHLVLEIKIHLCTFSHFSKIDFSPLAVLGAASLSIRRIDLYVHTGNLPSALTRAQLLFSLGDYEGIMRSIKEGILVIHSEKTATD